MDEKNRACGAQNTALFSSYTMGNALDLARRRRENFGVL